MRYSNIALATAPVFVNYVSAYGSAIIKNSCADDVYFWSCGDTPGSMVTVGAGQSHPQTYYSKQGGGGISLKIGVKYPQGPKMGQIPGIWDQPAPNMTQFEYTVGTPGPPANAVFYDISNINGYPFVEGGVKMTSSDGSVNVACPKGVEYCQGAYNAPHDDHATGSAADHVDLTLELCSEAPGMTVGGANAGQGLSGGGSSNGASKDGSGSQGGSSGSSSGSSSGESAPPSQQPNSQSSQPPSQPSHSHDQSQGQAQGQSHDQSQGQVNAPEKLAVNAVAQGPTTTSTTPPPSITPTSTQDVVVVWNTVTADPIVVTVRPSVVPPQKRHEHVHQHAHQKINKKRHGNNN